MPNDAAPLSDALARLRSEPDYAAAYAALAATERGRWFLTEFAARNRHADTEALVVAIARIEAAIRGERLPEIPPTLTQELHDLVPLIARIEAAIAASGTAAPDGFPAVERIQDVAFALRERDIAAPLCDALEAAVREMSDACARSEVAAARAEGAAALLRELRGRVDAVIALMVTSGKGEGRTPADAVVPPPPQIAEAEDREDECFAAAIGALAASFPDAGDAIMPAAHSEAAPAAGIVPRDDHAIEAVAVSGPVPAEEPRTADDPANARPALTVVRTFEVEGDADAWVAVQDQTVGEQAVQKQVKAPGPEAEPLNDLVEALHDEVGAFRDQVEAFQAEADTVEGQVVSIDLGEAAGQRVAEPVTPAIASEEEATELFAQTAPAQPPVLVPRSDSVDEDPDDFFAPHPNGADRDQPGGLAFPHQRPVSYASSLDPLAAVRALSEEELIALFG